MGRAGCREETVIDDYRGVWLARALEALRRLMDEAEAEIELASQWCADSIAADGLVHLFGSGHSRIPVEEAFPRYGSFAGFSPLVELSTSFHTQVVGSNGQRQAMFIERTSGFAEQVLANFDFHEQDVFVCFSVSGSSALPVEMAQGCKARGLRTIAVTAAQGGNELSRSVDLVIDLPIHGGDAVVHLEGLDTPVGPVSSFLYVAVVNEIKVRTAARLVAAGQPPLVLTGVREVGQERSRALFEGAYAEHARRASTRLAGSRPNRA